MYLSFTAIYSTYTMRLDNQTTTILCKCDLNDPHDLHDLHDPHLYNAYRTTEKILQPK